MPFSVRLTHDAEQDLESIADHIAGSDGIERAAAWLEHVEAVIDRLDQSPHRGAYPKELLELGIRDFRQVRFKPYRLIYRFDGKRVNVVLIADGRRDMRSLLERRLLGAE